MFRLMKLAIYGLLGYAIYEFVRGLMQGESIAQATGMGGGRRQRQGGASRELNRALETGDSRMNMTGPTQGERVTTEEASGESVPHTVGRGVIHR